jgi:hypothetical protein
MATKTPPSYGHKDPAIFYNSVNNSENRIFPGETAVLYFRTIFLAHLTGFKKNGGEKMVKNGIN